MSNLSTLASLLAAVICFFTIAHTRAADATQPSGEPAGGRDIEWQYQHEVPRPDRKGKPQKPAVARLWLPPAQAGGERVRGLVYCGDIVIAKQLATDPLIRQAAADMGLGVLQFNPSLDATFDWVHRDSGEKLNATLAHFAQEAGHPELAHAPLFTIGHSTGGIFARNIAYWRPAQTLGVLHIKSGNLQDGIPDTSRSLAGIPFLAINGEFEQFGPAGGDIKGGLRSRYSLEENKSKKNQSQWILIRTQLLDRRRKNPDNLMALVVHRGGSHTSWDEGMTRIAAQFIRSAAAARLPDELPTDPTAAVELHPLAAESGWLSDPDLKDPHHPPAPYADYTGDKSQAFWYPDEASATTISDYHTEGWDTPDPTAGQPADERYAPPPELRDTIDERCAMFGTIFSRVACNAPPEMADDNVSRFNPLL